jgi:hypothetical protein
LEIRRITSLFVLSAAVIAIMPALGADIAVAQSRASGGFIDSATGAGMRPRLSAGEIQSFAAPSRFPRRTAPLVFD